MNLAYAMGRGVNIGITVGAVLAIGGIFAMGFAPAGLGLASLLPGGSMLAPLGMVGEVIGGTLVGAVSGGAIFGTTHVVTHAIPGLPNLLGDTTPPPQRRQAVNNGRSRGPSRVQEFDEFDDRDVSFTRQIDEERMRDEMQRELDLTR